MAAPFRTSIVLIVSNSLVLLVWVVGGTQIVSQSLSKAALMVGKVGAPILLFNLLIISLFHAAYIISNMVRYFYLIAFFIKSLD